MKRRNGKPDPFERIPVVAQPVDDTVVGRVIETFVADFVVSASRERARLKLGNPVHRSRALHDVGSWLDPRWVTSLEGNTGFPQHLRARFGALTGVLVTPREVARMTIAESACAAGDDAFFLADGRRLALVFPEGSPPQLCQR